MPRRRSVFFFCCYLGARGAERFNFRSAVRGSVMRNAATWNGGVAALSLTLIVRAHPEWDRELGRRAALTRARRLAPALATEYLLPHAGRAWIISSSTIREFIAEQLAVLSLAPALAA